MAWKKIIVYTIVFGSIAGCDPKSPPKWGQMGGTLLGGATGGYIGSTIGGGRGRVVSTAVGAVLGAALGNFIGSQLDPSEQKEIHDSTVYALDSGESQTWRSSTKSAKCVVRPGNTDQRGCREYKTTIIIDGKKQEAYGRACKDEFGQWKIQN